MFFNQKYAHTTAVLVSIVTQTLTTVHGVCVCQVWRVLHVISLHLAMQVTRIGVQLWLL